MAEIQPEIKSFFREVTEELIFNIVYEYKKQTGREIIFYQLSKEFEKRVGYKPMDFFGLREKISDKGWLEFLGESPGLNLRRGLLSIGDIESDDEDGDMVWKSYNSATLTETVDDAWAAWPTPTTVDDAWAVWPTPTTIAKYRQELLIEVCDLMVQEDCSVDVNCANKYGNTPLHFIAALPCTCDDDLNLIRFLINAGANAVVENNKGLNILHIIAGRIRMKVEDDEDLQFTKFGESRIDVRCWEYGHRRSILLFLTQKLSSVQLAYLVGRPGRDNNTVMHEWVMSTKPTFTSLAGTDPTESSLIMKEIKLGSELLHLGGNLSTTNKNGLVPLHLSFNSNVFEFLIDKGAVCRARNYDGETPALFILKHLLLSSLISCGRLSSSVNEFRGLLGNSEDIWGTSTLNIGQVMFSLEQFKELTMRSEVIKTLSISDAKAVSPLEVVLASIRIAATTQSGSYNDLAKLSRLQELMEEFLSQIITSNPHLLVIRNNKGQSPLHMLLDMGASVKEEYVGLTSTVSIVRSLETLLLHGADVNAVDAKGQTALHLCCLRHANYPNCYGQCAQILIRYDAKIDLKDSSGKTVQELFSNNKELQSICVQTKRKVNCLSRRHYNNAHKIPVSSAVIVVGKYRYSNESLIHAGAFGCVYVAIKDEREDKNSKMINCRTFALKRLEKARIDLKEIKREIDLLLAISSQCENIVGYHETIEEESFYYIALELMEGDLHLFVEDSVMEKMLADQDDQAIKVQATLDMIKGLAFLHQNKFLHRDLKPGNILYAFLHITQRNPPLCFKIADFGLAKNISTLRSCTSTSGAVVPGTRCWMAPELVSLESQEHTTESDVFALGLVLHYLLSLGHHPFVDPTKDWKEQPAHVVEKNIVEMKVSLHEPLSCEAKHLVKEILAKKSEERPTTNNLEQHPFLWSDKKKVEFLIAVGNQEEAANPIKHPNSAFEQCLQNTDVGREITTMPWDVRVPDVYLEMRTSFKRKGYRTNCVMELLRFIRNAYSHKEQRSPNIIVKLEENIFLKKFPSLVLDVYLALKHGGFLTRSSICQAL